MQPNEYEYTFEGMGYRRDLEDMQGLIASSQQQSTFLCGDIDPRQLGAPLGMFEVLKLENQGQMNSCAGNSATTILEGCLWHQSGEVIKDQLSRMFAYINGQGHSGISGDSGATLSGVIKGLQDDGCPLEEFAPYTGRYYTQFNEQAKQDAQKRKLLSWMPVTHVDQVYEGLVKRIGGLYLGINWTDAARNPKNGRVERFAENRGASGGFHAVCVMDWCNEKDGDGYPDLRLFNSHGTQYGERGTSRWTREAMHQAITAPNTTAFFLSDMQFIRPRFNYQTARWTA